MPIVLLGSGVEVVGEHHPGGVGDKTKVSIRGVFSKEPSFA